MQPPSLAPLLILQDRDRRRRDLDQQIQANPKDIAAVEARINAEKNAIETARTELKELETKKKLIEGEITATEQKAAKYRTQQLEVRKNDEYRAIGNEIEHLVKQIEGLEEQELAVMYAIDEAKKKFAAAEAVLKQNIAGYEQRLRDLRARDGVLRAELATAKPISKPPALPSPRRPYAFTTVSPRNVFPPASPPTTANAAAATSRFPARSSRPSEAKRPNSPPATSAAASSGGRVDATDSPRRARPSLHRVTPPSHHPRP